MSDHLIYSPNLLLDFANSTLGFRKTFGENSELVRGKLFSWMITTLFRGHPEQYLQTLAHTHTHHAPLQRQTLLRRGLGIKGVGEPLPRTAGIFVFDVSKMLRLRLRSVKTFLAAPVFCTLFTAFSYYPTTCGLAVSSPSSFQIQLL